MAKITCRSQRGFKLLLQQYLIARGVSIPVEKRIIIINMRNKVINTLKRTERLILSFVWEVQGWFVTQ